MHFFPLWWKKKPIKIAMTCVFNFCFSSFSVLFLLFLGVIVAIEIKSALLPHATRFTMQNDCMKHYLYIVFHMLLCHWWISSKIVHIIGDSLLMSLIMCAIHYLRHHRPCNNTLAWLDLRYVFKLILWLVYLRFFSSNRKNELYHLQSSIFSISPAMRIG